MRLLPRSIRQLVVVGYAAVGIGLLPWAIWLSSALKPHHLAVRWDLAWSGFDTALAAAFLATAVAAHRRSPWVGVLAAATGTLLLTDAWFDCVLESHADELRFSLLLALVAEVPMAAVCFWVAYRTERVIERALHLAAARQRAAEGDLVGVFEVRPDRQPAGEAGHPHAPA